ncbi:hypothetical protein T08_16627 [Trichinella sp. T8]|nr:hypothetical protein T08_16627 [Trichinella sp. T8]
MVECMGIYSAALCMLTGSHDLCGIKGVTPGWSHWGSIIFAFGPTVHLLVVVIAILLDRNLAILLDRKVFVVLVFLV